MTDFPHPIPILPVSLRDQYWVLCFSIYVQPLGRIIREHSINFHHYADDLQVYAHFDLNKSSLESTISRLQNCICNVQTWFSNNKLKINPDKTLFMAFVPPYYTTLVDNININIGSSDINVVFSVFFFRVIKPHSSICLHIFWHFR